MDSFEKIKELFSHFPGIGPRQAERFAYYLLAKDTAYIEEFKSILSTLRRDVAQCSVCMKFFAKRGDASVCNICSDPVRDTTVLMVVAKDSDLQAVEKSSVFTGKYFVLGGLVPILEKVPQKRVRIESLKRRIETDRSIVEIILALSATHEGENTGYIIEEMVKSVNPSIKISKLGRGLSTGLEIEYSDKDTIEAALKNKY